MRLAKLHIENFGCIGPEGLGLLVDDIVVLIGPNDVGKSTVLDAYEAFASMGSPLPVEVFHHAARVLPIVIEACFAEVTTEDAEIVGATWVHDHEMFGECVRVRWRWEAPDKKGVKQSFDPATTEWVGGGMGGWDTLIQSRIPVSLRIRPDAKPEEFEGIIRDILVSAVKESVKRDNETAAEVLDKIQALSLEFRDQVVGDINAACALVSERISEVFPGYSVEFEPNAGKFEPEKLIGTGSYLKIDSPDEESTRLSRRGTGVQRSFLWSALSALAELGHVKHGRKVIDPGRPRILLIEEPESFLHPPSIRRARECLYTIAMVEGWQVICSTHSPVFIDVSKPHTTIVRLARRNAGAVRAFQTDKAEFDAIERTQLQMVRACDPSINEFFFADRVLLVEGDTEALVLSNLLVRHAPDAVDRYCVLNCHGKGNLPLFMRILNQFGSPYTVIHDSDAPRAKRQAGYARNGMWTMNETIVATLRERVPGLPECRLIVHVPDFEGHYFGERLSADKPFSALKQVMRDDYGDAGDLELLREFIPSLLANTHSGCYADMDGLTQLVRSWLDDIGDEDLDRELWQLD